MQNSLKMYVSFFFVVSTHSDVCNQKFNLLLLGKPVCCIILFVQPCKSYLHEVLIEIYYFASLTHSMFKNSVKLRLLKFVRSNVLLSINAIFILTKILYMFLLEKSCLSRKKFYLKVCLKPGRQLVYMSEMNQSFNFLQ